MAKHKYSVVIPLYNKKETIERALNSVIAQNHEVEIVVVDDGSTDGGAELFRKKTFPCLRLINQLNQGVSAARNRGIAESKNELIAFLDADDEWLDGYLDSIDQLVELYPSSGGYATSFQIIGPEGLYIPKHPKIIHPFIGIPNYFYCVIFGAFFCASSIVVRKEAINEIGGFDIQMKLSEDNDAWARLALHYPIAYDSNIRANYHQNVKNQVTKQKFPVERSLVDSIREYVMKNPNNIDNNLLIYSNLWMCIIASHNIWSGYPTIARDALKKRLSNALFWNILYCHILSLIPTKLLYFFRKVFNQISHK